MPVIAFSTDANVAARGVYLLSFLPESDVDRIVDYAVAQRQTRRSRRCCRTTPMAPWSRPRSSRSVARRGGRVVALERYPLDTAQMQAPARNVAQAAARADAIFIPDGADAVPAVVQALAANGVDAKRMQLLGTGLWDDPRIFANPALQGAWYAAPDSTRLPQFLGALSHALRPGSGAHRDARL